MSNTPKFSALKFSSSCGCGGTPTKAFVEVQQGGGSGLIIRVDHGDVIRVTQYAKGGVKVRDSEVMTPESVEPLL